MRIDQNPNQNQMKLKMQNKVKSNFGCLPPPVNSLMGLFKDTTKDQGVPSTWAPISNCSDTRVFESLQDHGTYIASSASWKSSSFQPDFKVR